MLSRRHLLSAFASVPWLAKVGIRVNRRNSRIEFIEETHELAAESARGYHSLAIVREASRTKWIIAPAVRDMDAQSCAALCERVRSGEWLLFEGGIGYSGQPNTKQQALLLGEHFDIQILPPVKTHGYIAYSWPIQKLVRSFHVVTPVVCDKQDVIARVDRLPVCLRKRFGLGGIVYLGSMLGPGLMAEEREAHVVADSIIRQAQFHS